MNAPSRRAQANLFALVVALVLLTTVTTLGVAVADGALAGADRSPAERHAAAAVADRLVVADAPWTAEANVVNGSSVERLTAADVDRLAPAAEGRPLRIALDDETVVQRRTPVSGVTVRRGVLVATWTPVNRTVNVSRSRTVRLPRGVERVRLRIDAGADATVKSVRANDRVVLHAQRGVVGTTTVSLSATGPTTLRLVTATQNSSGTVALAYRRRETTARTLTVTVDGWGQLSLSVFEAGVGVLLILGVAAGFGLGLAGPPTDSAQLDRYADDAATTLGATPATAGNRTLLEALAHTPASFERERPAARSHLTKLVPATVRIHVRTPVGTFGPAPPSTVAVGRTTASTRHGPVTLEAWYG
ncbi:hypothetical protein ACFQJD_03000 [Haloplanus sp. GCM10025708]|uniref:DUF7263 family protein n=1 Tax=Haloplanus sp. GCM10025708 TaxID=3252679 RepID=UPI003622B3F9